jgi:hypothetical protein
MRIKSDFHDYYDSIQSFGQDQSLIYIRKKIDFPVATELKTKKLPFPSVSLDRDHSFARHGDLPTSARFYVIGFAGKVYPLFELIWCYDYPYEKRSEFCYSMVDIDRTIEKHCNKKAQESYNEFVLRKKRSRDYWRWRNIAIKRATFVEFFDIWGQEDQTIKAAPLFEKYPVWVIEERRDGWYVCYNCNLKPFKFFKVKDPMTAYQEINMFLSNIAVPQKPIPVPSDKDMVSIKGFDKFSFRKEPSKKKK